MEQNNQPEHIVQQTALMKFMEYLRENNYYIDNKMVERYWELMTWEREYSKEQNDEL